jgi:Lrp/AsnC family transcriptional regulator
MERSLDDTDRRILRELQRDSSRPMTEIAEAAGLSHAPCWRRIQRLRAEGVIKGETVVLDAEKLGWETEIFVLLKISPEGRANIDEFRHSMMKHERVLSYSILLGNVDAMLHVVARNMRDYNRFYLEHLSSSPYISEINSMTVLSRLKDASLPL